MGYDQYILWYCYFNGCDKNYYLPAGYHFRIHQEAETKYEIYNTVYINTYIQAS